MVCCVAYLIGLLNMFTIMLKSKDLEGITTFKVNVGDCVFTADGNTKHFPETVFGAVVTILCAEGYCQILPFMEDGRLIDCGERCVRLDIVDHEYQRPKAGRTMLYNAFIHELRLQQIDVKTATFVEPSQLEHKLK